MNSQAGEKPDASGPSGQALDLHPDPEQLIILYASAVVPRL
jgi:hypothetical protein